MGIGWDGMACDGVGLDGVQRRGLEETTQDRMRRGRVGWDGMSQDGSGWDGDGSGMGRGWAEVRWVGIGEAELRRCGRG